MPRERVHWHILHEVTRQIAPHAPLVHKVLTEHMDSAELGAMTHDAPYYLRYGKSAFEKTAEFLHGSRGEDTFDPLREMATKLVADSRQTKNLEWAFLLGMVSHAIVDAHFHPLVYFFSGDYGDIDPERRRHARTRHRLFETYLDRYFEVRFPSTRPTSLSAIMRSLRSELKYISRWLAESVDVPDYPDSPEKKQQSWNEALTAMARFQSVFLSTFLGVIVRTLNRLGKGNLSEIDSLFFYGRTGAEHVFDEPLSYRNPFSGESHEDTVGELADEAIKECARIFRDFESVLQGSQQNPLVSVQGRSLNLGLYGVPTAGLTYFSDCGVSLPGLSIHR